MLKPRHAHVLFRNEDGRELGRAGLCFFEELPRKGDILRLFTKEQGSRFFAVVQVQWNPVADRDAAILGADCKAFSPSLILVPFESQEPSSSTGEEGEGVVLPFPRP